MKMILKFTLFLALFTTTSLYGQDTCDYWMVGKITYELEGVSYGYNDPFDKGYEESMHVVRSYDLFRSIETMFNDCPNYKLCMKPFGEEQYTVDIEYDIYIDGGLIVYREEIKPAEIEGVKNPEDYPYVEKMKITPTGGTAIREGDATLTIESIVLYRLKPSLCAKMKKLHDEMLKREQENYHE